MSTRSFVYWFLIFIVWLAVGLISLFASEAMHEGISSFLLAVFAVIALGSWIFVGIPVNVLMVVGYLRESKQVGKTPKSFLKECPKCGKRVPVASEECPSCKTKLKHAR